MFLLFTFSSHTGVIMGVVHVCCVICVHEPKQNIILWSYFGLLLLLLSPSSALASTHRMPRRMPRRASTQNLDTLR